MAGCVQRGKSSPWRQIQGVLPTAQSSLQCVFFPVIVADNYGDGAGDNHSDGDGNSDIAPGFYNSNIDKIGDNGDHAPGRASFQVQADLQNPGKESQREALRGQQVGVILLITTAFIIRIIKLSWQLQGGRRRP